jgi:hypothetical protein
MLHILIKLGCDGFCVKIDISRFGVCRCMNLYDFQFLLIFLSQVIGCICGTQCATVYENICVSVNATKRVQFKRVRQWFTIYHQFSCFCC